MSSVITTAIGSARDEAHAQHPHQRRQVDHAGDDEAEPVDREH